MNKTEFLQKAKESSACPENLEEKYEEFLKYQRLAIATLQEFHRVCMKNDIHYSLHGGTLLGAVRDGGLIPWDYDVDILVPLEQRERLVEAMRNDLGKDYYIHCPEVDERCRHYIMRVTPRGYNSADLHVDVFYYFGGPDSLEERKKIANRFVELQRNRFYRYVNIRHEWHGSIKVFLALLLGKIKSYRHDLKKEYLEFSSYSEKYPYKDSKYIVRADQFNWDEWHIGRFREYYAEDFIDTIPIQTENGEFMIIKGYDRFLTMMYGDYTKTPPIEDCLSELLRGYNHFKYSKD